MLTFQYIPSMHPPDKFSSYPGGHLHIGLWLYTKHVAGCEQARVLPVGVTQGSIQSWFMHSSLELQSSSSSQSNTGITKI